MCRLVHEAIVKGEDPLVLSDLRRIAGEEDDSTWVPSSPQEIAGRIFHTAFMGMEKNSSPDTRQRARDLGTAIGSYHLNFDIDTVVSAVVNLFTTVTKFTPRYKMYGHISYMQTNYLLVIPQVRGVQCFEPCPPKHPGSSSVSDILFARAVYYLKRD